MKKLQILLLVLGMMSCKKETQEKEATVTEMVKDPYQYVYGNWVGDFIASKTDSLADGDEYVYNNKVNLVIKKIEGNKVFGQSIVSGNFRLLQGEVKNNSGVLTFTLYEPKGNKNDGQFECAIIDNELKGKWSAYDQSLPVTEREFSLKKEIFKYNPKLMLPNDRDYIDRYSLKIDSITSEEDQDFEETEYSETYRSASSVITKINASTTKLKEEDLKNLKKLELEIIRNTIYARHGYSFKKKSFRQFFDYVDWYIPISNDVSGKLTLLEQNNIKLLDRFQKYAEDNYDTFGR